MSYPSLRRAFVGAFLGLLLLAGQSFPVATPLNASPVQALEGCYKYPTSKNSPTGIAGCFNFGTGIASYYGPGNGVAMNFCTWTYRHTHGCGRVTITSLTTGRRVTVPVVDFCDCYTGTSRERLVDLQYGVLSSLGLGRGPGLYKVTVYPAGAAPKVVPKPKPKPVPPPPPLAPELAPAGLDGTLLPTAESLLLAGLAARTSCVPTLDGDAPIIHPSWFAVLPACEVIAVDDFVIPPRGGFVP